MNNYQAPLEDINFVLEVLDFSEILALAAFDEVSSDLAQTIINEAARFFEEQVAPTNFPADKEGAKLEGNKVLTAPSLDGIYQQLVANGWPSLCGDKAYGGQGMPQLLGFAVDEISQSANVAFSLNPLLTKGVVTALGKYGSESQKQTYLPKLISAEWAGTMNLTEPQAGSDLALIKTQAVPEDDHYLISGSKIFITWGDHELSDNIIHLVLARLPDAPEGVKGISMFVVPKYMVNEDGSLGDRNDVYPVAVEHKLGIHASPTCALNFGDNGGAVGYLVGQEHQGLIYMFTMMNHARLEVGLQGVAVAERAYQQARDYAKERIQGGATIIHHPDVRRMLMQMKALTEAGRLLSYSALAAYDLFKYGPKEKKDYYRRRVDLLTPLVKGWCTEMVNEVTSLGLQVHGGTGYIEETGAAQHYRDARILAIYEGTNGIQSLDLIGRKFLMDNGKSFQELLEELTSILGHCKQQGLDIYSKGLEVVLAKANKATELIVSKAATDHAFVGAAAFNFLMMTGTITAAAMFVKQVLLAKQQMSEGKGNKSYLEAKTLTVQFFVEQILPRASAHAQAILGDQTAVMAMDESQF